MRAGHHDVQELSKTYYQISRARTKAQHSIINYHIPLYFPEMHKPWVCTRSDWWSALAFLALAQASRVISPWVSRAVDRQAIGRVTCHIHHAINYRSPLQPDALPA